jgi:hypothetical protein
VAPPSSSVRVALSRACVRRLYASWPRVAAAVWVVKGILRVAQYVAPGRRRATTSYREAKGTGLV